MKDEIRQAIEEICRVPLNVPLVVPPSVRPLASFALVTAPFAI